MRYTTEYNINNFDMAINVAQNAVNEFNDGNYSCIYDAVSDAIDAALIYYDEQWEILKQYCLPEDANLIDAIDMFTNEIYDIIKEV